MHQPLGQKIVILPPVFLEEIGMVLRWCCAGAVLII